MGVPGGNSPAPSISLQCGPHTESTATLPEARGDTAASVPGHTARLGLGAGRGHKLLNQRTGMSLYVPVPSQARMLVRRVLLREPASLRGRGAPACSLVHSGSQPPWARGAGLGVGWGWGSTGGPLQTHQQGRAGETPLLQREQAHALPESAQSAPVPAIHSLPHPITGWK